ncbi:MAG TPA: preprotein translocase subunit SecG [Xanthobacteraceae bacterium]|nr:preprotein translocase subunit SecG [Xanthobacteraceae bacterium]
MQTVLILIHILVVLALIGVVLLQKSEGGALGMGGGGGFMTSRGSGNVLTKTTAVLAGIFFATSLLLSVIAGLGRQGSIFQGGNTPAKQTAPAPANGGDSSKSILDQLKHPSVPPNAPAPTGPQVPQSK